MARNIDIIFSIYIKNNDNPDDKKAETKRIPLRFETNLKPTIMIKKSQVIDTKKRLYSLDALRGFDMFWITGGGFLAIAIAKMAGIGWLETQMHHVE